mmetsp:Transcript_6495/g.22347  ORF Transcript_6495/g.22347 Transcript_6495/m.22347 type:complete len:229 (+) Transcript_6495:150-836(+)
MHPSLVLGCPGARLHPHPSVLEHGVGLLDVLGSKVLEALLHGLREERDQVPHAPLVPHGPAHALGDLNLLALAQVPRARTLLHGVQRTHPPVQFDSRSVLGDVVVPRGLLRAGKHGAAHHRARPEGEGLGDVAGVLDPAVRDDWDAVLCPQPRDVEHGRGLPPSHSADLLGGADGPAAHADPKGVRPDADEALGLSGGHHVAGDDLQVRVVLLDPLDHLHLVHGVALA